MGAFLFQGKGDNTEAVNDTAEEYVPEKSDMIGEHRGDKQKRAPTQKGIKGVVQELHSRRTENGYQGNTECDNHPLHDKKGNAVRAAQITKQEGRKRRAD